jgi:hypothetical protein
MRKFFILAFLLFGFFTILMTGCRPAASQPDPATTPAASSAGETAPTQGEQAGGGATAAVAPAVALPTSTGPVPTVITTIPAPAADTAVVTGVVFSTNMNAPLSQIGIYLGEYMYLTPGPEYMVTMRQQSSPHTIADSNGRFLIADVPPGKYPLLLWTPFNSYVVPDETGEKELVVEVVAGEVIDLGELQIAWP